MLKNVGMYPFGLFKVELKDLIATMISEGLMEFAEFIDNCAKTPSFLSGIDKARVVIDDSFGAKVIETTEIWA
jgi:hypothetical protein